MRLSQFLLPVLKEDPSEAQIVSHRLMLRAGMIRQLSAGNYNWLPLGWKVLKNIGQVVREEMDKAGGLELLMPTLQPAELWKESGRYDAYGKEMLRMTDRHDRALLYGPTNEEVITDIVRNNVKSYKQLPLNLYHIQWKFRDEVRPRFGVMRGREFLMKDAYSFDVDAASARTSYVNMFNTYLKIFARLGLKTVPVRADTGPVGGDLSHEFHVLAETGESAVYYEEKWETLFAKESYTFADVEQLYAMADEMHVADKCKVPVKSARGIEVGHVFYLGTKYSEIMKANVMSKEGKEVPAEMGCYGIGVSRLVGAIIEASHDEKGIIWPESIAPFKTAIINLRVNDSKCNEACEALYQQLSIGKQDPLYDDRDASAGEKFATQDLIGTPWQIVVGPKGLEKGVIELKNRKTGEKQEIAADVVMQSISA
jgi:prolyl-tRNA synthetase